MRPDSAADRYQRLQRKLSGSTAVWHSGRLDHLADALRALEREMQSAAGSDALTRRIQEIPSLQAQ